MKCLNPNEADKLKSIQHSIFNILYSLFKESTIFCLCGCFNRQN